MVPGSWIQCVVFHLREELDVLRAVQLPRVGLNLIHQKHVLISGNQAPELNRMRRGSGVWNLFHGQTSSGKW